MKLWLVRHARPMVDDGVCYGAMDIPAETGATWGAASALARHLPAGVPVWRCPLQRCDLLARALLGLRPDLAVGEPDPRLREMDFGLWEGVRWSEIPPAALERWRDNFAHHPFGGAESVQGVMRRVGLAMLDARQLGCDVAWITHAGVIRAATLLARGVFEVSRPSVWPREGPGFGECVAVDLP